KRKQFVKGILQLSEEGSIQVFKRPNVGVEELIVGVVGVLQFEVLEYRLLNEYGVEILMQQLPYRHIRWIKTDNFDRKAFSLPMDSLIVEDEYNRPVILMQNEWNIQQVLDRNKKVRLEEISVRGNK
ncbi:MAG: peptide chain release factor 3, partial [Erysipelotrichaceae bacterium]|nr:peptide chain release factor 3 [Erysipelotrichaceae bacterium]